MFFILGCIVGTIAVLGGLYGWYFGYIGEMVFLSGCFILLLSRMGHLVSDYIKRLDTALRLIDK